ncbi:MAG TPA: hypothetical protein VFM46_11485 [Pseudomonadales bacterium]|nr:hypothetical protein [Pseudomonadales bacterium]
MSFYRRLSPVERMYLVEDTPESAPLCHQWVLEGQGELNEAAWRAALHQAAEANPDARVRLAGRWKWLHWRNDGALPEVIAVDGSQWDGSSEAGAPWLLGPLPARTGPVCKVYLMSRPTPRVLIRMHHAAMDGRGFMQFIEDIFRCLRGEKPVGSNSVLTETDLVRRENPKRLPDPPLNASSPFGAARGEDYQCTWRHVYVKCNPKRPMPRVMKIVADAAWSHHPDGIVRIRVPADMRRLVKDQISNANLTGIMDIELTREDTLESIGEKIKFGVTNKWDMMRFPSNAKLSIAEWLPLSMFRMTPPIIQRGHANNGLYRYTGTVSNLGRFNEVVHQGGGFVASRMWAIPVRYFLLPTFIALFGNAEGFDVTVGGPKVLFNEGRGDKLIESIRQALLES